ncbi:hypothetical protein GCM10010341_89440 [Streptomyces noursei]|nr:hypothetical protein GCM10010341_89440 [Streptomyces noursei]
MIYSTEWADPENRQSAVRKELLELSNEWSAARSRCRAGSGHTDPAAAPPY